MTTDARNYVAAWMDYRNDVVVVLERNQNGDLFRKKYNPPYYFYIPDESGEYTSIYGDKLIKAEFDNKDAYNAAKNEFKIKFESDISPVKRVLMDYYYNVPTPRINYAFLDIEVDYAKSIGFAGPTNPYAIINAVTIYQSWTNKFKTYAVPPLVDGVRWTEIPGNTLEKLYAEINGLIDQKLLREGHIPEIKLCDNEYELIQYMLEDIQEADIISGWNSEFYDIPYIAERLRLAGGDSMLAKLEHSGCTHLPRREMVNRFGSEEPIYKFTGRSHLDYMKLFQKFTFEGRTSYALGNILQEEVGVGKLEFDGSLEDLYKFNFPTFVAYNFRDVDGLVQLDAKFKFIALANQMAHENTVGFDAVLGTVAYVETGITNHAHNVLGKIVHDKVISQNEKVEGAIVMTPTPGLYDWIGSVDINSLYPNTIRSLNISPEMIVGQFTAKEEAWKAIRDGNDSKQCLILESGEQIVEVASKWKEVLTEQKWAISAYGTVFDQGNGRGVIADILKFWYTERKRLQAEKKKYAKLAKAETDPVKKAEYEKLEEDFDLLQLTKKISMNSLYGALLNAAFRFGDERMGASTTASGRAITTHMINGIEELVTGKRKKFVRVRGKTKPGEEHKDSWHYITHRDQLEKLRRDKKLADINQQLPEWFENYESVIYGDTDSCYFKTGVTGKGDDIKAAAIEAADLIAETVNATFPQFMRDVFNCQPEYDDLIKAGREVVGIRGLFQAKKKYMIKVIDLEGAAVDKLKSMGSEIKKADTPKIIQKFLKTTVDMILDGQDYDAVVEYVNSQRVDIIKSNSLSMFSLGVAKQVNDLEKFSAEYNNPGTFQSKNGGKLTIPGHARAACNYNFLLNIFDKGSKLIRSGDKVLVFYLSKNEYGFDSIAFPAEMTKFPVWFNENFTVNKKLTEDRMFDSKLEGIFSALGKDVPSPQSVLTNKLLSF